MRNLFLALVILCFIPVAKVVCAHPPLSDLVREADDYYLGRAKVENVQSGLDLLRQAVANDPRDYEAWWRIAKFASYMVRHTAGTEKLKFLADGIEAGKKAVGLQPDRVEGHFWLSANYGLMAEAGSFVKGLSLLNTIRREIEVAVRIDPDYEQGAPVRTLARIDYRAPFFKGGNKRRAISILKDCLKRFPENSLTMLYLADCYMAVGRRDLARQQLEKILQVCPDPQYEPELSENQSEAQARLAKYFRRP